MLLEGGECLQIKCNYKERARRDQINPESSPFLPIFTQNCFLHLYWLRKKRLAYKKLGRLPVVCEKLCADKKILCATKT